MRVPGSARADRVAYLRIIPASDRCAASASRGSGAPLGPVFLSGTGSIATAATPVKRGLFPTPRVIRVCMWITATRSTAPDAFKPSRRVKPFSTTINVYGDLFGASAALYGTLAPPLTAGSFEINSLATFPFNSVHIEPNRDPGCPPPMTEAGLSYSYSDPLEDALFHGAGGVDIGGISDLCDDNIFNFSRIDGSALGSINYDSRVTTPAPGGAAILHLGACALTTGALAERTPDEAATFLRAVGCVPGSVVTSPRRVFGYADGSVVRFHVDGAQAQLAPPGTRVDMVVNGRSDDPSQPAPAGRVMTWNIEGKIKGANKKVDMWAAEIARVRPDVIALQETCHQTSATLITRRLRDYGLNYHSESGPAPKTSPPVFNIRCGVNAGELRPLGRTTRFRASQTTLSLNPLTNYKNTPLGRTCKKKLVGRICLADRVGRNVLAVTTTVAGRSVRVFNAHIGTIGKGGLVSSQKQQIDKVVKQARRYPQAMILGDFNVEPGSPALATLAANGFVDIDPQANKTYPASGPDRKIDYIFLKGLQPAATAVVPDTGAASDHRPLYSEVR